MISTVSTVSVSSVAIIGTGLALAVVAIIALMLFLVSKELISTSETLSYRVSSKFLNVGIVPLLMVFALSVAITMAQLL